MKLFTFLGTLALVLFVAGCSHTTVENEEVPVVPVVDVNQAEPHSVDAENPSMQDVDVFAGVESIDLKDVAGGVATGQAWVIVESSSSTEHRVVAFDLPELTNGDFYEGWLVRSPASLGFISTGEMLFDEEGDQWVLNFSDKTDLSDYPGVVITLEPDDGDPAPAAHVLEGSFVN